MDWRAGNCNGWQTLSVAYVCDDQVAIIYDKKTYKLCDEEIETRTPKKEIKYKYIKHEYLKVEKLNKIIQK